MRANIMSVCNDVLYVVQPSKRSVLSSAAESAVKKIFGKDEQSHRKHDY